MERGRSPALTNCRLVRRARKASEWVWCGLSITTRADSAACLSRVIPPRIGRLLRFRTSASRAAGRTGPPLPAQRSQASSQSPTAHPRAPCSSPYHKTTRQRSDHDVMSPIVHDVPRHNRSRCPATSHAHPDYTLVCEEPANTKPLTALVVSLRVSGKRSAVKPRRFRFRDHRATAPGRKATAAARPARNARVRTPRRAPAMAEGGTRVGSTLRSCFYPSVSLVRTSISCTSSSLRHSGSYRFVTGAREGHQRAISLGTSVPILDHSQRSPAAMK